MGYIVTKLRNMHLQRTRRESPDIPALYFLFVTILFSRRRQASRQAGSRAKQKRTGAEYVPVVIYKLFLSYLCPACTQGRTYQFSYRSIIQGVLCKNTAAEFETTDIVFLRLSLIFQICMFYVFT